MAQSGSSAVFDLLVALDDAVARRAGSGWAHGERAASALVVIRASGVPTSVPVDWVERFGLDEADTAILTVAVAAERDPALHLLLGLLGGDSGPGRPTPALALELAGIPVDDPGGLSRCAPLAPLGRLGLLIVEGGDVLLARRLRVPDRVAGQLRGDHRPTPSVLGLLVEQVPIDVTGTDAVAAALSGGEQIVWVHAPGGTPGTALAAGAVGTIGRSALVADLHRIPVERSADADDPHGPMPDPAVVAEALKALVLEAAMAGSVLILAGCERAAQHLQTLRFAPIPVIGVSTLPWDPKWTIWLPVTVEAARLTVAERLVLWQSILPGVEIPRRIAALRLTPEQMWQVARSARRDADLDGLAEIEVSHLSASARRLGRGKDNSGPGATIDDLVLPDHARREVGRLLDWARYRDEVMGQGQLQGKGGKGTGICALFSGGPGTGKTLAAHVVADTLGIQLLHVELASVVSKYVGESEKNLERVFAEAEALNSVLFFDEADALFGARSGTKDAHDRYANLQGDLLPAATHGDLRRDHDPGHESARQSGSGVRAAAPLHRHVSRSRSAHPGPAVGTPFGCSPDDRSSGPAGHRSTGPHC